MGQPRKAARKGRWGLRHLQSLCSWGRQLPHFGRPALSPSSAASVHLHPSWRRRVVPLRGRYRPPNCLRWCPLQLKWSRGPQRPPLGPLMGDLCFATQVWDLSPFQRWGKVGKVGGGGATCPGGLCVVHHRRARVPLRGRGCSFFALSLTRLGAALSPTPGSGDGISTCGGLLPTTPLFRRGRPKGGSELGREGSLSRGKNPALRQQGADEASSFQAES